MKLKFTSNSIAIIQQLCELPDTAESDKDIDKIFAIINNSSDQLRQIEIKDKIWVKNRREISFFWSLVKTLEDKIPNKIEQYSKTMLAIKDIQSGKLLTHIPFIRLAMSYGILRLSDTEIEHLIRYNKV